MRDSSHFAAVLAGKDPYESVSGAAAPDPRKTMTVPFSIQFRSAPAPSRAPARPSIRRS